MLFSQREHIHLRKNWLAEPSKHICDLKLTYRLLICLFISFDFPQLHIREVGGRSLIYLSPFIFIFWKVWIWLSHYFEAWPGGSTGDMHTSERWEDGTALLGLLHLSFPPSSSPGPVASAAHQRPLLPRPWEHRGSTVTHRLQLSQLLDTSTDRLSSHVSITPQTDWRGKVFK